MNTVSEMKNLLNNNYNKFNRTELTSNSSMGGFKSQSSNRDRDNLNNTKPMTNNFTD